MIEKNEKEETIDIKSVVIYYSQYWYFFLISVLFSIFIGFLVNRYTSPVYSASTTLLIRDDGNSQMGAEYLLEELEVFSGKKNLKNEIIILNSYNLASKVVENLNLGISYFEHGFIKSNELFETAPFIVNVDSSHLQLTGIDFFVDPIDDSSFELKINSKNQNPYNIKEEKLEKSLLTNLNSSRRFKYDAEIKSDYYCFSISKTNNYDIDRIKINDKSLSFKLHQKRKYAQYLINNINISPINKDASVLKITMTGNNIRKIKKILNQLTKDYIKADLDEKNVMLNNTINFIDKQLKINKDSLSLIENQLKDFKTENPNLDIVDKDFGTFFQKQKLDNNLSEQSVHIKYYYSLLKYLKDENDINSIVSPTSMGITNPELNKLITQLLQNYQIKADLELTTTTNHPTYQAIIAQIENTKKTIIENVKNLISSAQIYEKDLKNRIIAFNSKINKLPEAEKRYLILKRKYQYNEQITIYLSGKKNDAQLAKAGTKSDHKIIDTAFSNNKEKPIKPQTKLSYFIALIIGLIFPISFIYIRNFFSETISNKSDLIAATQIPVLGLIGHSDKANSLIVPHSSKSILAESFRAIRTNIQYLAAEKENKIITVTSSVGGEGKTFIAMNLASIFALAGHKTILIGADLRKPKISEEFKLNTEKGLSSFLINKATIKEITQTSELENLDIIASGPTPPNPAELLNSKRMSELLKKLNKQYDYVIFDTPPIGLVTDGVILMKDSDISLYIVRHNYSKIKTLNVVNNLFSSKKVNNINIIINDFHKNIAGYGYGYGYGDSSSGYGYYENES